MSTVLDELRVANEMLRSAYSIASRSGASTNWLAFKGRLLEVLLKQSAFLNGTTHQEAATCTPRSFQSIEPSLQPDSPLFPTQAFVSKFKRQPTDPSDLAWCNGYQAGRESRGYVSPQEIYDAARWRDHEEKIRKEERWKARRLDLCKCDHNEYCDHCFPPEFRSEALSPPPERST